MTKFPLQIVEGKIVLSLNLSFFLLWRKFFPTKQIFRLNMNFRVRPVPRWKFATNGIFSIADEESRSGFPYMRSENTGSTILGTTEIDGKTHDHMTNVIVNFYAESSLKALIGYKKWCSYLLSNLQMGKKLVTYTDFTNISLYILMSY